jgi:hypothetical protein
LLLDILLLLLDILLWLLRLRFSRPGGLQNRTDLIHLSDLVVDALHLLHAHSHSGDVGVIELIDPHHSPERGVHHRVVWLDFWAQVAPVVERLKLTIIEARGHVSVGVEYVIVVSVHKEVLLPRGWGFHNRSLYLLLWSRIVFLSLEEWVIKYH